MANHRARTFPTGPNGPAHRRREHRRPPAQSPLDAFSMATETEIAADLKVLILLGLLTLTRDEDGQLRVAPVDPDE